MVSLTMEDLCHLYDLTDVSMSEGQSAHYNQYSGYYRPIGHLSAPWVANPEVGKPRSPLLNFDYHRTISQSTPQSRKIIVTDGPQTKDQPKRKRRAVADLLRRLADKISGGITAVDGRNPQVVDETVVESAGEREVEVPLQDWKAWGYYACPKFHRDGGYVQNHLPSSYIPPNADVEGIHRSLKDDSGKFHPERWIRGLQHPALPPRPERWKEHPKGVPLPFPWQCQLNPLLQHSTFDKPPLDWDIRHYPSGRCYLGRTGNAIIPISAPDKAQPATYPFVTHMYINSLADDPYPEHFWPFYVVNDRGVTVGDVLETIWKNFQQHISRSEFESWENLLSRQQTASFAVRMRGLGAEARRIDILGTQCLFKGLEPHPNREGWSMFLGLG